MFTERIWYQDPIGLFNSDNFYLIWPSKDMTFAEQLNCLMRFSLYFALLILLIKQDINILFVPIFMGIFTYYIYMVDTKNKNNEKRLLEQYTMLKDKFTNTLCVKPTDNNPFMNVLMTDYSKNPNRPAACKRSKKIDKEVKQAFDKNLYRDVDDIFHKNASDRQFYTNPVTTIPNDQTAFAKWLYHSGPTCKEGNGDTCYRNMSRGILA